MVENILVLLLILVGVALIASIINLASRDKSIDKNLGKISFKESMDLVDLPVITFFNNGKKFNFLLDTGSSHSSFNLESIEGVLGNPIEGEYTHFIGADGNPTPTQSVTMPIVYKDKEYQEDFQVIDLSKAFGIVKSESGVNLHGILGNSFFQKYKYVINFDELIVYSLK